MLETFSADENIFKLNSAFSFFVPIQAVAAVITMGTAQIAFKLAIKDQQFVCRGAASVQVVMS